MPVPVPPEFHVVELPGGVSPEVVRRWLAAEPAVEFVESDGVGWGGGLVPDDPGFPSQWHLATVGAPEAWEITRGSPGVTVAILDTGLNTGLPDFAGRLVPGYDFANDDADPSDDHGHGSAVASVAVGTGNNGTDTAGIDWNCRIMPLKVLDETNYGFYSWWALAVRWATDNGADVINLSAGGSGGSSALTQAIDYAIGRGVVFVTISQNDGSATVSFPGNLRQCITVGATRHDEIVSDFSNHGPAVDLVAPGGIGSSGGSYATNIVTTNRAGETRWWWGTSFAAPQVAGAAALLKALDPGLRQSDVETILCAGADDQVGDERDVAGFDPYHGYGRLNLPAAIALVQAEPELVRIEAGEGNSVPMVAMRASAPSNGAAKRPFDVAFSDDGTEWNRIADPASMTYGDGSATWVDDGTDTGTPPGARRLYRWIIRR